MEQLQFITIVQKILILVLQMSAPILLVSVVVGLLISVFQSVTQIQEATLTFVPKIIAGIVTIIVLLPWMLGTFMNTINELFDSLKYFIHS